MEVKMTRRIPASVDTVYRAWTDPKFLATWLEGTKHIMNIVVDGLWFWEHKSDSGKRNPHYGRYLALEPNARIAMTWMSEGTHGLESKLEIKLTAKDGGTELVLEHTGLPDDDGGRAHVGGWNYFVNRLAESLHT
jgi:uncharacterized protein YndB with AHSA1/START domain